jgi:hypothetical protein
LLFGGSGITGANLGFNDPGGHLYAAFYYGQQSVNQASLLANGVNTNAGGGNLTCTQGIIGLNAAPTAAGLGRFSGINPFCTAQQSEEAGWFIYYFSGPRVAIGGTMDNQQGKEYTFYNPNEVTCGTHGQAASAALCSANYPTTLPAAITAPTSYFLNGQSSVQAVEGYLMAFFGPKAVPTFSVQLAYDQHIGVNPFTGGAWTGGDAEEAVLTYASKGNLYAGGGYTNPFIIGGGRRNSNVVSLSYNRFGLNSLANIENAVFAGTTPFENNIGFTGINGLQAYGMEAAHWFSDSVRLGFNAIHLSNDYNTPIPTSTGGFITQLQENQLNAEMYVYFF